MFQNSSDSSEEFINPASVINLQSVLKQKLAENRYNAAESEMEVVYKYDVGTSTCSPDIRECEDVLFGSDRDASCGSAPDSDSSNSDTELELRAKKNNHDLDESSSSSETSSFERDKNHGIPKLLPIMSRANRIPFHSPAVQILSTMNGEIPSSNIRQKSKPSFDANLTSQTIQKFNFCFATNNCAIPHQENSHALTYNRNYSNFSNYPSAFHMIQPMPMESSIMAQTLDSGISNASPDTQSSFETQSNFIDYARRQRSSMKATSSSNHQHSRNAASSINLMNQTRMETMQEVQSKNFLKELGDLFSCVYCLFMVLLGAVLSLVQMLSSRVSITCAQSHLIGMYAVSICFLIHLYLNVLNKSTADSQHLFSNGGGSTYSCRKRFYQMNSAEKNSDMAEQCLTSPRSKPISKRNRNPPQQTFSLISSIYMRVGLLLIGIVSMVRDGLHFGRLIDQPSHEGCQRPTLPIISCLLSFIFTFIQLYFIFLNSRVILRRWISVCKFGCMHLIATNVTVWIHLVKFTHKTATPPDLSINRDNIKILPLRRVMNSSFHNNSWHLATALNVNCTKGELLGRVVDNMNPYLVSFTIQYCFISAVTLISIWRNVTSSSSSPLSSSQRHFPYNPNLSRKSSHHPDTYSDSRPSSSSLFKRPRMRRSLSVISDISPVVFRQHAECIGSNKGFFLGLCSLLMHLVSLIIFAILIQKPHRYEFTATVIIYLAESSLLLLVGGCVLLVFWKIRVWRHNGALIFRLHANSLYVSYGGVLLNCFIVLISIPTDRESIALFAALGSISTLFESTGQLILAQLLFNQRHVLTSSASSSVSTTAVKAVRECVSFLILANVSLCLMYYLEPMRLTVMDCQIRLLGLVVGELWNRTVNPFLSLFRFQLAVSFLEIWRRYSAIC